MDVHPVFAPVVSGISGFSRVPYQSTEPAQIDPPAPTFDPEKAIDDLDRHFEEIIGDLDRIRLDHGIEARDLMAEMEYLQKAIYRRLRGN